MVPLSGEKKIHAT